MSKSEKARAIFAEGYSCSQAVCAAFAEDFGLDRDTALKISGGFGGGMGGMGEVCGALTGAFMILGLKYRGTEPGKVPAKAKTSAAVKELTDVFCRKHGEITCRGLIGCDVTDPEQAQKARDAGRYREVCPEAVGDAAEILEEILKRDE